MLYSYVKIQQYYVNFAQINLYNQNSIYKNLIILAYSKIHVEMKKKNPK